MTCRLTVRVPDAEVLARVHDGAATGLTAAAHHVAGIAADNAPLLYGDLRSSLVDGVVAAQPDDLHAAVGSNLPYAARQHEDLTYRHREGGAKFLERAAKDSTKDVGDLIAAHIRNTVRGG